MPCLFQATRPKKVSKVMNEVDETYNDSNTVTSWSFPKLENIGAKQRELLNDYIFILMSDIFLFVI